jgi:hypothetical protein
LFLGKIFTIIFSNHIIQVVSIVYNFQHIYQIKNHVSISANHPAAANAAGDDPNSSASRWCRH